MDAIEILVGAAQADDGAPSLADLVEAVFRGPLAEGGAEVREGQIRMAREVAAAIEEGPSARLAVEAATGSGKSLALLVPAVLAILRAEARGTIGARVIVSTAGIPLQRQVVGKDVPALARALGIEISAAVVKGRNNWGCHERLDALADSPTAEGGEARRVARWIREGGSGDREDLPWPVQRGGDLSVSADDCLGRGCPRAGDCLATAAIERAKTAKIVVMNHAYLAVAGGAWVNPGVDSPGAVALVVDEGHELSDALRRAQSGEVRASQADHWRREIGRLTDGVPYPADEVDAPDDVAELLPQLLPDLPSPVLAVVPEWVTPWAPVDDEGDPFPAARAPDLSGWAALAHDVADAVDSVTSAAAEAADGVSPHRLRSGWFQGPAKPGAPVSAAAAVLERVEVEEDYHRARIRKAIRALRKLASRLNAAAEVPDEYAAWVERDDRGREVVHVAPTVVVLPDRPSPTILCSATLGAGHPKEAAAEIGVEAREVVLPHPWPVEEMGVCFVPKGPNPKDSGWAEWCERGAVWFARQCGGGVLVLASSWARAQALAAALRGQVPWTVRVQGEAGRTELVEWFRTDGDGILVGTASFRQGLDVAGRACRGVLIDRIPFPAPGDPLEDAIAERFKDAFRERSIPVAAQALRQSVGRLLRTAEDRGAICVLDPRLAEAPWARRLREAVAPIPISRDPKDVRRVLDGARPEGVVPADKPRSTATTRTARSVRTAAT